MPRLVDVSSETLTAPPNGLGTETLQAHTGHGYHEDIPTRAMFAAPESRYAQGSMMVSKVGQRPPPPKHMGAVEWVSL